jgi:hypothetical protein
MKSRSTYDECCGIFSKLDVGFRLIAHDWQRFGTNEQHFMLEWLTASGHPLGHHLHSPEIRCVAQLGA